MCLSDLGYIAGELVVSDAMASAALLKETIAGVIALADAQQLVDNYNDQRAIAQRSINITRAVQNEVETVFWPREDQFLAEFSVPEPLETPEHLGRRYAGRLASAVYGAFASKIYDLRVALGRHTTSANEKQVQDILLARAMAVANARVLGRSIGFAEYQARFDVNVNRQIQAVQLGRGLIAEAMKLLQDAGQSEQAAANIIGADLNDAKAKFGRFDRERMEARNFGQGLQGAQSFFRQQEMGIDSTRDALSSPANSDTLSARKDSRIANLSGVRPSNQFSPSQDHQAGVPRAGGDNNLVPTGIYVYPVVAVGAGEVTIDYDLLFYKSGDPYSPV